MTPLSADPMLSLLLASSAAMLLVLAAMSMLRQRLGAELAFALWLVVPLACLFALWPAPGTGAWRASVQAVLPTVAVFAPATPDIGTGPAMPAPWRILWIIGSIAFASSMIWQQWRFRSRLDLHDFGQRHEGRVVLRAFSAESAPMLLGAWRPQIVLPAGFEYERADTASGQVRTMAGARIPLSWDARHAHFARIDMTGAGVVHNRAA